MKVLDQREAAVSIEIVDGGSLVANFGIRSHAGSMISLRWETTLGRAKAPAVTIGND